ncbi:hypothetical protein V8G54_036248 [Vigna mungo]|uniref:Uncharacterized protein n=1 Tax=Vigna mungo TaxID=3915 RepID=A0AAQ3MI30_VIGMU
MKEKKKKKRKFVCSVLTCHVFSDLSEGLQIAPYDCVHEDASLLLSVTWRYVNHVGLDHNRASVTVTVQRRHRPIVPQAVVAADHAEAHHVPLVVKDLESLGARNGREARDHAHLAERANANAVAGDHVAALHEVLVPLRIVEASHHGPHGGDRRLDRLNDDGAALAGPHRMRVVARRRLRHASLGQETSR